VIDRSGTRSDGYRDAPMKSTRAITVFLAFALFAAACGGEEEAASTTSTEATTTTTTTMLAPQDTSTTTSSTTTSSTTTSTPGYDGPVVPLTGLPIDDPTLADRRALAVKIDNHPDARPQSGILEADAMMEILVEGGYTRFVAIYHTTDNDYVGPIRSARPTDPTVIRPMNAVMVLSGGQDWIISRIASYGVRMIGEVAGTFRINTRPAPHNLYGNTDDLRATADSRGYSDEFGTTLYEIAPWAEMPDEVAEKIVMRWATDTYYTWIYEDGRYYRHIGETTPIAHMVVDEDGNEEQISAEVLVVIEGIRYVASPSAGVKGNAVPAIDTLGSGPVEIFYQGTVLTGTWERSNATDAFTFTTPSGGPFTVPPGDPWIAIFPEQRAVRW